MQNMDINRFKNDSSMIYSSEMLNKEKKSLKEYANVFADRNLWVSRIRECEIWHKSLCNQVQTLVLTINKCT